MSILFFQKPLYFSPVIARYATEVKRKAERRKLLLELKRKRREEEEAVLIMKLLLEDI